MTSENKPKPPWWLNDSIIYLTVGGSQAAGYATAESDLDLFAIAIPPKEIVFPHFQGVVFGFTKKVERFDRFTSHGLLDKATQRQYDLNIHNIVNFFRLAIDGNPNILDVLFTDDEEVLTCNEIGKLIRDNKHLFLSMECFPKYLGYASSQQKKLKEKNPKEGSKRKSLKDKFGFDCKFAAMYIQRLLQLEQLMTTGTLNLKKDSVLLSDIRAGKLSYENILFMGVKQETRLQQIKKQTVLPETASEYKVKQLLMNCLDIHYSKENKNVKED